ncbi:DUF1593-domain-containing protein [Rhizodiscina lignyota]|uniref:DUF1593-domain-containing protein n=1 Tax=Rhizodiscina lignyota TaxID=1504668 RepID=A0A9P4I8S1_9PEZI|nr:DUF1593-domain-containing protein [Rhizodiscina lignyota]
MHFLIHRLLAIGLLASAIPGVQTHSIDKPAKLRTIVTTDMEQDDLASLIRYILYTNDLDTQGIIYTSSRYHWAGDGKGTEFFLPGREYNTSQTSWRWTGTQTIQDKILKAYAKVYPNLRRHDPSYPTPNELLSKMDHDTDGSNLIRSLLLNEDPRPLYLQAWGGTSTIARALKSIEERYSASWQWPRIRDLVSRKAVILASGFQDETYVDYIAPTWPQIRVEELSAGYSTWGYNCNQGQGNTRGLPDDHVYFTGDWIRANIEMGPYGKLYRSWLDGQSMPGDPEDIFGNITKASSPTAWCKPLGQYDFLSEGDDVAFNPLLTTGIQDPSNPNLGSWGGRAKQNTTSPDLWGMVETEKAENGTEVENYTTNRWIAAVQNDFAARMHWTITPEYRKGNHAPSVDILNGKSVKAYPGSTVKLSSQVSDPDGDHVTTSWWQYFEEGTYPGAVTVTANHNHGATVKIPADAKPGQTISVIVQGTDDGHFPLTRYDRVFIHVV